ncbi:MAG: hypothetical protein QOE55_462, partial [Acidobacteriaceae bacterium]|nr:hypothetical protein [Acidobacteriaceae bacterium]
MGDSNSCIVPWLWQSSPSPARMGLLHRSSVWMRASILFHTRGSFSISICGFMKARAYHGYPAQEIGFS